MTAPTLPPDDEVVERVAHAIGLAGTFGAPFDEYDAADQEGLREMARAAIAAAIAPPAVPASVERRMAFMEVERRVEEAVKARDARIARMEEVLRFYARQSTWAGSYCATTGIHSEPDAYYDKGAKARAALDEWTAKS